MKILSITIALLLLNIQQIKAQYEPYSLYQFTAPRVNPAYVTNGYHAAINILHRNQQSIPNVKLQSTYVNAKYPFLRKNTAWSAIGIELSSKSEGLGGLFKTNGVGVIYGVNIPINKSQSISTGTSVQYFQNRMNISELYTGNQYIPDYGFDLSLDKGEDFNQYQAAHFMANWGVSWQRNEKKGQKIDQFGLAFYNINRAAANFTQTGNSKLPIAFIAEGSKRLFLRNKWLINAEVLFRQVGPFNSWALGGNGTLDLYYLNPSLQRQSLSIIGRYLSHKGFLVGATWDSEFISVGANFEFPLHKMVNHSGIFEVGIAIKKPLSAKYKPKKKRRIGKSKEKQIDESNRPVYSFTLDILKPIEIKDNLTKDTIDIAFGQIVNVVDTATKHNLYVAFALDSKQPIETMALHQFMDQMVQKLQASPKTRTQIIGHTDDIGDEFYNKKLSVERAYAIYKLLLKKGANIDQMEYFGRGEVEPILPNSSPDNRARNRRVEIVIIEGK